MKKNIFIIAVALLLIGGVSFYLVRNYRQVHQELSLADSLMAERPDSSLAILRRIGKEHRLSGEDRALCALLTTKAEFKNHMPPETDSLLRIATDYYKQSADSLHKAWSYYYYARFCNKGGEERRALEYYQKAADAASVTQDYELLDLIYNHWGLLLQEKKPYDNGIEKLKKSLEYSLLRGDTIGQIYVMKDLAWSYLLKKDYVNSLTYHMKGIGLAKKINEKNLLAALYNNVSSLYCEQKEFDEGIHYADLSLINAQDSSHYRPTWASKVDLFLGLEEYDSARFYIEKMELGNNYYTKAGYYNQLAKLNEKTGSYKVAYDSERLYAEYLDSIYNSNEDVEITALQKRYDYSLMENEKNRAKLSQKKAQKATYLSIILAVIVLALVSVFHYRRQRLKDKQLLKADKTIKDIQNQLLVKSKELQDKQHSEVQPSGTHPEKNESVFRMNSIVRKIDSLNALTNLEINKKGAEFVFSPQDLKDMQQVVNWFYDGFVDRLRQQYPGVNEEDINICCLLKMNVSGKNIRILMDLTSETLKRRKTRIKNDRMHLSSSFNTLEEFLLSF